MIVKRALTLQKERKRKKSNRKKQVEITQMILTTKIKGRR
jgi:hypothetical protein